jgi:hypothetical protein
MIKVMICSTVSGTHKIMTPHSFVVCSGLTGTDIHLLVICMFFVEFVLAMTFIYILFSAM